VFFAKPSEMKFISIWFIFCCPLAAFAQTPQAKNVFIITTDGFRWQEIFTGADSVLINNPEYVQDTALMKQLFWDDNVEERRKKLMPFFWSVIAGKGQLYGNREYDNNVNVANFFKISYPGYSEIITGYPDPLGIPNIPIKNRNTNILEYLNDMPEYHDKVAAFTSWNIFPYIFNKNRSGFTLNSGYEDIDNEDSSEVNSVINDVQGSIIKKTHTRYDELTFLSSMEYIKTHKPRVMFLGLGETDEFAHAGKYDMYLQQAAKVDRMIAELWYYVQTNPYYKNNTTFIITTDHGRGKKPGTWHTHGVFTRGSGDAWFAVIGPGIAPQGEMKTAQQHYQKQIAATVATMLGEKFTSRHTIGQPIELPQALPFNNVATLPTSKIIIPAK